MSHASGEAMACPSMVRNGPFLVREITMPRRPFGQLTLHNAL